MSEDFDDAQLISPPRFSRTGYPYYGGNRFIMEPEEPLSVLSRTLPEGATGVMNRIVNLQEIISNHHTFREISATHAANVSSWLEKRRPDEKQAKVTTRIATSRRRGIFSFLGHYATIEVSTELEIK